MQRLLTAVSHPPLKNSSDLSLNELCVESFESTFGPSELVYESRSTDFHGTHVLQL
jgi:hypothetical protein